jgi:transcriptional regulator with XRE-family HTH domain
MTRSTPEPALKSMGRSLRDLRKAARLTQADLVARAGISRDTLSRVENGESAETAFVQRIASVLGYQLTLERKPVRAADMRRKYAHLHAEDAE